MNKIGIFGGSFNPIHIGHIILANDIFEEFQLDKIIFIPAPDPPLKSIKEIISYNLRYKMVKSAISEYNHFMISDIEKNLPKPSYTINTLNALINKHPDSEFYLIIGSDQAKQFREWKDYKMISDIVNIIVMERNGENADNDFLLFNERRIDISSTEIRERIKKGLPFKQFLTEKVYRIIKDEKLYR